MNHRIISRAAEFFKRKKKYTRWQKVVSFLAAIVVFCTTYALILPAITMEKTLVCMAEEHTHTEECYLQEQILDCEETEEKGHSHTGECYLDQRTLICPKQESLGHAHTDSCFLTDKQLVCELETIEIQEGHTHDEFCYTAEKKLICELEESEPVEVVVHEHTDACYIENTVQICELQEAEAHAHDAACYEGEIALVCELEETEGHEHTEECYHLENVLNCEKEEHVHIEECYASSKSDPTADVETAEVWEATFADVELTGEWATDVLAIAKTQIGYAESTKNFIENELGEQSGYTRYGAWYGVPYGDWCAMFVSFCLDYAGVEVFPLEANCQNWIEQLKAETCGLYREADGYMPKAGDIIFFDTDLDGISHHVGLVAEVQLGEEDEISTVTVIEGNSIHDCVESIVYDLSDPVIMGYGELIQPKDETETLKTLTFENDQMTVTAAFPEEYEIPENAVLSVKMVDPEENPERYDVMSLSVRENIITEDNRILGSLKLYDVCVLVEDQVVEVPNDLQIMLTVNYKDALFNEEEMALAAELTVVTLEEPMVTTFWAREAADALIGFNVTEPEAELIDVSNGVTAITLESYGLQTFGVATKTETRTGNVWKRVNSFDEIQDGDTLTIVSVEGSVALTYGDDTHGVPVIMEQIKGNEDYYDVTLRSNATSFAENANGLASKFTVSDKKSSTLKLKNQSGASNYLVLSGTTLFKTSSENLTFVKESPENTWKIKNGDYYLTYDRDEKMLSSNSSKNARRDMFVLRLVDTELLIPKDTEVVNNGIPDLPEKPEYDNITPSGEKSGNTTLEELKGFSIGYTSDPATSNLEEKFSGNEADDGKVMTDKSVIYMGDDYGAFDDYEEGTFGVTLSTLGQVTSKAGEIEPLMDIVIILDTSYSMINNASHYLDDNGDVRMKWAMKAVNEVIDQALQVEENRVGVVTFSDTSQVVLPLDHYTTVNGKYLDLVADNSINDANFTPNHGRGNNFYDLNINANVKNSSNVTPTFDFQYGPGYPNWEGTFTQSGIAEAAKILLNNPDTTDSYGNARQPVIILITDGGPTLCSSNYKDPLAGPIFGNSGQTAENDHDEDHSASSSNGTGVNRYGINGYYTILTAQYYKDLVGSHYDLQTKFASVGIGIDAEQTSSTDSRLHDNRYCRAVLNPTASNLSDAMTTFDNFTDEGKQLNQLLNNTFTKQYVSIPNHSNGYTTIGTTYSAVPVLKNPYTDFEYADQYYTGTTTTLAVDLISYLNEIQYQEHTWSTIIENMTDVMLEDPIGIGMEVKEEPKLRFGQINYDATSSSVDGNTTTYVYDYQVSYETAYPENVDSNNKVANRTLDLSQIEVTVTTEGEGIDAVQNVKLHVPEELLPVFYPEKYGTFYYEEYPVRLIFKVGLTEAAIEASKTMEAGASATYYTNRWDDNGTVTAEGTFDPYDGTDNPNTYPFDEMQDLEKSSNPTETQTTYFGTSVDENYIVQRLGNNGRLVLSRESTVIMVQKKWSDTENHDPITVHLLADGTIVDGKSVELSEDNNWTYTWKNLTKYHTDGTEIVYTVSEDYVAGYDTVIEKIAKGTEYSVTTWTEVKNFTANKEYVLISQDSGQALAADSDGKFKWVEGVDTSSKERPEDESVIWKAGDTGTSSLLQSISTQGYIGYAGYTSSRYFTLNSSSGTAIGYSDNKISFSRYGTKYYFTGLNDNKNGSASTSSSSAMLFDLYQLETTTETYPEDIFVITNTKSEEGPLDLTLKKVTDSGTVLTGAAFDLYQASDDGILTIPGAESGESKGKIVAKDITVDEDGVLISIPKEDAVYYLVETNAPDGFVLLKKPVRIVVKDGVISEEDEMAVLNGTTLSIINKAGFVLPETGGSGAVKYILSGMTLMGVAAFILLKELLRKRGT